MTNADIQPDIHITKIYDFVNREHFNGHFPRVNVSFRDTDSLSFGRIFMAAPLPCAELIVPRRFADNFAGLSQQICDLLAGLLIKTGTVSTLQQEG